MNENKLVWGHASTEQPDQWHGAYPSREEAIDDGRKTYGGDGFWIMSGACPKPSQYIWAASIIEDMGIAASEDCGEVAEDWPNVSPAQQQELQDLLNAWAEKYAPISFWHATGDAEYIEPEVQA